MKTAIVIIGFSLVGCGSGGFSTTTSEGSGNTNPVTAPEDSGSIGTGGVSSVPENTGGVSNTPSGNGGKAPIATGGVATVSNGGSAGMNNGAGGMPVAAGGMAIGGSPSGNGGNLTGAGGMITGNGGMVAAGGMPMAAGGTPPMGSGGMVIGAGGMGIDLHCPPSPNPYLACEPGQYVRSCSGGLSDLLVSNTWDSAKVHQITSDSPFPLIFGGDQFGYHVQAGCVGGSVTFTLPP
jgi:hypothetical protein